jgi:hypothetical protein
MWITSAKLDINLHFTLTIKDFMMHCIAKNIHPINKFVDDLLIVEVANDALQENYFEYVILNNQSKAVRKGNFKGPIVQLCTRFISQGTYKLQIKNTAISEQQELIFNKA